ncbi:MAG: hypothetical protein IKU25_01380 [Clostridia bacterium]|nr:hypothetical protein [Clostridia bacterium]
MKYEKPEMKVFEFEVEDVITTSSPSTTTTTTTSPIMEYTLDGNFDIMIL